MCLNYFAHTTELALLNNDYVGNTQKKWKCQKKMCRNGILKLEHEEKYISIVI